MYPVGGSAPLPQTPVANTSLPKYAGKTAAIAVILFGSGRLLAPLYPLYPTATIFIAITLAAVCACTFHLLSLLEKIEAASVAIPDKSPSRL